LKKYTSKALKIKTDADFESEALRVFQFQYENIPVYQNFVNLLGINPSLVLKLKDIPFLPISVFKSHQVHQQNAKAKVVFKSSGTTGMDKSSHYVEDLSVYQTSYINGFKHFYGNIEDYIILALLPSYLEQGESSLVFMVDELIKQSNNAQSGFYLDQYVELVSTLKSADKAGKKTILLGVSYALLDLIENFDLTLKNTIIMETGGMKGRRKEMIKEELHQVLKKGFGVKTIHSEYGMTELLSQAYSKGDGIFETPAWMKILVRDATDPLTYVEQGQTGGLNVIDLFNYYSCAFLATQDLGKIIAENTFEIAGRFDHTDIRGCNLLLA
jgi:phenylacetate-coenzyme A ligase PaaK-like adenylate-forming protein